MTRRWHILMAALAVTVALAAWPAAADANGRFPAQQSLRLHPTDPDVMYAPATFGLLVSTDGGTSFAWVCEEAIGYGGTYDPDYAVHADGAIFATTFDGLRVSRDQGCTWATVLPFDVDNFVSEIEEDPLGRIWAGAASATNTTIYVSDDDGTTFVPTIQDGATWWNSIVAGTAKAPATQRVLAAGYVIQPPEGDAGTLIYPVLHRSNDGGETWESLALDGLTFPDTNSYLYIEAIDRTNPDIVWARVTKHNDPLGDAIYRSTDGGSTWTMVLDVLDDVRGFVVRQNGDVIAGTRYDGTWIDVAGEPVEFVRQETSAQIGCLAERFDGELFACGSNYKPDNFAIAHGEPDAWEYIFTFADIAAPLSCGTETVQYQICEVERWCGIAEQLVITAEPIDCPDPPDAGVDAGGGGGGKGCCDSNVGGGGALPVGLTLVGLALVLRRRRPRRLS